MTQFSLRRRVALPLALTALSAAAMISNSPAQAATSTAKTYKGSAVTEQWGTVQVSIVVKNGKITNVKPAVTYHTVRSQVINSDALPTLKQEVLQAQSANVQLVSGATDLSRAYISSLQSAINKATKAKAL